MSLNKSFSNKKIIILALFLSFFVTYFLTSRDSGWIKPEKGDIFTVETQYSGETYENVNALTVSIVQLNALQFFIVRMTQPNYENIIAPIIPSSMTAGTMEQSVSNAYAAVGAFTSLDENKKFNPQNIEIENINLTAIPAKGTSAGLAYALSLINTLNNVNIDASKKIAASGAISENGEVLPVSGLDFKLLLAEENDVDLVFIPKNSSINTTFLSMEVVEVGSLGEAIEILCERNYYKNC